MMGDAQEQQPPNGNSNGRAAASSSPARPRRLSGGAPLHELASAALPLAVWPRSPQSLRDSYEAKCT